MRPSGKRPSRAMLLFCTCVEDIIRWFCKRDSVLGGVRTDFLLVFAVCTQTVPHCVFAVNARLLHVHCCIQKYILPPLCGPWALCVRTHQRYTLSYVLDLPVIAQLFSLSLSNLQSLPFPSSSPAPAPSNRRGTPFCAEFQLQ